MIAVWVKKAHIVLPRSATKSVDSDEADYTILPAGGAAL